MLSQHLVENIATENTLSYSMLNEAVTNNKIKQVLADIGEMLIKGVLNPLSQKLDEVDDFKSLNKTHQDLIINLAAELTAERQQYGALIPDVSTANDVIQSITKVKHFLAYQEEVLGTIKFLNSIDELAVILKVMVELGFIYYEAPKSWHSDNFDFIKNIISPTKDELAIRLLRQELGQEPQLATAFGIGKEINDLAPAGNGQGRKAGKAVFGDVSMLARLNYLQTQYDKNSTPELKKEMEYFCIPLNKDERQSVEIYAKRCKTFFENLIVDPRDGKSMPLIASVSRASGRLLASLYDLGAFKRNINQFDVDKLQLFSNVLMGFIVHAGHHSIIEVAEVYNRVIDCAAIDYLENNKPFTISNEENYIPEKDLPYTQYGSYLSFFHKDYKDKMHILAAESKLTIKK